MKYTRNCPDCSKEIEYANADSLRMCTKNQTLCRECGLKLRASRAADKPKIEQPRRDFQGETIGCWSVIALDGKGTNSRYFWKVKCNNCAFETIIDTGHINKRLSCRNCRLNPKGFSGAKRLFYHYQAEAKKRKFAFELTFDEFRSLTSANCYFCGTSPKQVFGNNLYNPKKISHWSDYQYNGIDRTDNKLGYVLSNCKSCCGICNWAKHSRTCDEFKAYITTIVNNANNGLIDFLKIASS